MGNLTGFDLAITLIQSLGGLALFIYGMVTLSGSLEKISSGRMEKVLESLTNNVFKSVLLGMVVTATVQSSSATTVIVVGLVNAGILKLSSAIGVIMGANIGTTITGQILRLADLENNQNVGNILKLFTPSTLTPVIALVGVVCIMIPKKEGVKNAGNILLGLGILFTGMLSMTDAVKGLSEMDALRNLFTTLQNPVLGILAGAFVTMVIQSSSASVGILQAISATGAVTFSSAFPIILGQNIGTCITPILASIGASKAAKRSAFVHLYFNIIGTVVFVSALYLFRSLVGFAFWDDTIDMGGIANFHTVFNVTCSLLFLPFTKGLEKLAFMTFPDKEKEAPAEDDGRISLINLEDRLLISPALAVAQADETTTHMGCIALNNFRDMTGTFSDYDPKTIEKITAAEKNLDRMEDRLNSYLIKITERELTDYESRRVTILLHLVSEFERIGDYTVNLVEVSERMHASGIKFSESAAQELNVITGACEEIIGMAVETVRKNDTGLAHKIEPLEETIDYLNEVLKQRHIERLKTGKCAVESGIDFLDILINLERIADHCSNVALYIIGAKESKDVSFNHHEYIEQVHQGVSEDYKRDFSGFMEKYAV